MSKKMDHHFDRKSLVEIMKECDKLTAFERQAQRFLFEILDDVQDPEICDDLSMEFYLERKSSVDHLENLLCCVSSMREELELELLDRCNGVIRTVLRGRRIR